MKNCRTSLTYSICELFSGFSWLKYLKEKLMELCSLLGIVVDTNLCLAHRFFAVMENSCVQYPEMPYTSVTRIGKLKVFFSFLKNTTVLINVLKV